MTRPRVGFLGTGWIGRHRMEAMIATDAIDAVAVCDPDPQCAAEGLALAPAARVAASLDALLDHRLDGLVIATPSALHAEQAIAALESGVAVFCQKPLGRNARETRAVIEAARKADRLLDVDLSYRHTQATGAIVEAIAQGALGELFAIDLTFHNAYGPGKAWFFDRSQSGGGCVIDLGVHLVDLALWMLGFPAVKNVQGRLYAGGKALPAGAAEVEDFAAASFDLHQGIHVRLACSWNLHAGREAVIEAAFHGTKAGAVLRNVHGSFYDFEAILNHGTAGEPMAVPPDDWGGRAAAAWARRLAVDASFDEPAARLEDVATVLDRIYEASMP